MPLRMSAMSPEPNYRMRHRFWASDPSCSPAPSFRRWQWEPREAHHTSPTDGRQETRRRQAPRGQWCGPHRALPDACYRQRCRLYSRSRRTRQIHPAYVPMRSGGFVRDSLLGVRDEDLDLTVEGDGVAFAQTSCGSDRWHL